MRTPEIRDRRQQGVVSGLRIALAEITILRVESEQMMSPSPAKANQARRARIAAYRRAYNVLNDRLLVETRQ